MEVLLARLESCVERLESIGADHEKRLRALERRSAWIAGAIALACFLIPLALRFVN